MEKSKTGLLKVLYTILAYINDEFNSYSKTKLSRCMAKAAGNGNINIVRLCAENGATKFGIGQAMVKAAVNGHINIVKFCVQIDATRFLIRQCMRLQKMEMLM